MYIECLFLGVKKFNFLIYSVSDGFVSRVLCSRVVAIYSDADVLRCQSFYFLVWVYEEQHSINFLDLTTTRNHNKLEIDIYRKPTTTDVGRVAQSV